MLGTIKQDCSILRKHLSVITYAMKYLSELHTKSNFLQTLKYKVWLVYSISPAQLLLPIQQRLLLV